MTRVMIVFADGSKQMAHNLDDRALRWHERKLAEFEDLADFYARGVVVPDYADTTDAQQAIKRKQHLTQMKLVLAQHRALLETDLRRNKSPIQAIRAAVYQIDTMCNLLKPIITQHNIEQSRVENEKERHALFHEYKALHEYALYLEGILCDERLAFEQRAFPSASEVVESARDGRS